MWRLYYQLSTEAKARYFDEIIPLLHDTKASVLGDRDHDSWYLVFLGTKPSARGRGYAKKLLEDMTQRVRSAPFLFFIFFSCFLPTSRKPLFTPPFFLPSLWRLSTSACTRYCTERSQPRVHARARGFYEVTRR